MRALPPRFTCHFPPPCLSHALLLRTRDQPCDTYPHTPVVLYFLSADDIEKIADVCKAWRSIALDDQLWRLRCLENWGHLAKYPPKHAVRLVVSFHGSILEERLYDLLTLCTRIAVARVILDPRLWNPAHEQGSDSRAGLFECAWGCGPHARRPHNLPHPRKTSLSPEHRRVPR